MKELFNYRLNLRDEINNTRRICNIYKEVDLKNEIDINESDYYLTDIRGKWIQFIYSNKKRFVPSGFSLNGKAGYEDCRFTLQNVALNFQNTHYVILHLFNYNLNNDDILHFKFDTNLFNDKEACTISVGDKLFLKEMRNKYIYGRNSNRNYMTISLFNKKTKAQLINNGYIGLTKTSSNGIYDWFVDFKNGIIKLNNSDYFIEKKVLDNLYFMYFTYFYDKSLGEKYFEYNKLNTEYNNLMEIGNREGYIYLKPLKIRSLNKFKIKVLYEGKIEVQRYCLNCNTWKNISINQYIDYNIDIKIRIKLSSFSKVFKVFILS